MKLLVELGKEYPVEPQVRIQCKENTEEVKELVRLLEVKEQRIIGSYEKEECVIGPSQVLYGESVDGVTYIYTKERVYRTTYSLTELEENYSQRGFFRCSKSAVLNIHAIESLKSESGNRIDACLSNGEHIIISRRYAKQLRMILKGGGQS